MAGVPLRSQWPQNHALKMPSKLHNKAIELAVELQQRSKGKYDVAPDDLVRAALFILSHDAVTVHRAIGALIDAGWPAPAAVLLRTAIDISVSAMAVVNSALPSMAGFRYFYAGFRRHSRDQRLTSAVRRQMFEQIRKRLAVLPPELRPQAVRVIREKDRPYWFGEEFAQPSVVLERFSDPEMVWIYAQLSGAAHGSFLGMRLYRENPDAISINAEPSGRRAILTDLTSSRLLVDLVALRNEVEVLDLQGQIDALRAEIIRAANDVMRV